MFSEEGEVTVGFFPDWRISSEDDDIRQSENIETPPFCYVPRPIYFSINNMPYKVCPTTRNSVEASTRRTLVLNVKQGQG